MKWSNSEIKTMFTVNPFQDNVPFLHTLKISEFFSGYRSGTLPEIAKENLIILINVTVVLNTFKMSHCTKNEVFH